jgi:hypothetical protein
MPLFDLGDMSYLDHLKLNMGVAKRSLGMKPPMMLMAAMHALHGVIPSPYTSHHAIGLAGKGEEGPKYLLELLRRKKG